ncbi:MAG: hypothetical protein K5767_01785 [Clostridia bacterium]|nr:hypothetical protein [Clostridia bacterium]
MQHRDRGSALFLMELVIAVLFFSICSAVCLSMFGKSAEIALRSAALNEAVVRSSSLAEIYKAEGGRLEGVADVLRQMDEEARNVRISGGDGSRLEVEYEDMTLRLEASGDRTAGITALAVGTLEEKETFSSTDGEIYALKVRCGGGY